MGWKFDKKKAAAITGLTVAVLGLGTGLFWYTGQNRNPSTGTIQQAQENE